MPHMKYDRLSTKRKLCRFHLKMCLLILWIIFPNSSSKSNVAPNTNKQMVPSAIVSCVVFVLHIVPFIIALDYVRAYLI